MKERKINPNSLNNLKREKGWLDASETITIRVPKSLKEIILTIAHVVDKKKNEENSIDLKVLQDNGIGLLPISLTYNTLDKIADSKKSLSIGVKNMCAFLEIYMPRIEGKNLS